MKEAYNALKMARKRAIHQLEATGIIEKDEPKKEPIWAIVRYDRAKGVPITMEYFTNSVTVVKVMQEKEAAEKETKRLNKLNGRHDCRYYCYTTRLVK